MATLTETYHFLRLLYVKLGTQYCPDHDVPIAPQSEEAIAAPSFDHRGQLPTEIHRIGDPSVHAERAGRGQLMYRVAEKMNRPLGITLRYNPAPRPYTNADSFHVHVSAQRAARTLRFVFPDGKLLSATPWPTPLASRLD